MSEEKHSKDLLESRSRKNGRQHHNGTTGGKSPLTSASQKSRGTKHDGRRSEPSTPKQSPKQRGESSGKESKRAFHATKEMDIKKISKRVDEIYQKELTSRATSQRRRHGTRGSSPTQKQSRAKSRGHDGTRRTSPTQKSLSSKRSSPTSSSEPTLDELILSSLNHEAAHLEPTELGHKWLDLIDTYVLPTVTKVGFFSDYGASISEDASYEDDPAVADADGSKEELKPDNDTTNNAKAVKAPSETKQNPSQKSKEGLKPDNDTTNNAKTVESPSKTKQNSSQTSEEDANQSSGKLRQAFKPKSSYSKITRKALVVEARDDNDEEGIEVVNVKSQKRGAWSLGTRKTREPLIFEARDDGERIEIVVGKCPEKTPSQQRKTSHKTRIVTARGKEEETIEVIHKKTGKQSSGKPRSFVDVTKMIVEARDEEETIMI